MGYDRETSADGNEKREKPPVVLKEVVQHLLSMCDLMVFLSVLVAVS